MADHLKQVERTSHIPIIFLTAVATDVRQIYKAYSVGGVDYLVKPLERDIVRKKVAVFVDLYRQRQQIARQAQALREAEHREYQLRLAELRVASDKRYRKLVEGIGNPIGWSAEPQTMRLSFIAEEPGRAHPGVFARAALGARFLGTTPPSRGSGARPGHVPQGHRRRNG